MRHWDTTGPGHVFEDTESWFSRVEKWCPTQMRVVKTTRVEVANGALMTIAYEIDSTPGVLLVFSGSAEHDSLPTRLIAVAEAGR